MLRASALYIVIVITLLIGILCSSIITVSYYQRLQVQRNLLTKRLYDNSDAGINLLMGDYSKINTDEEVTMDLYGEGRDSITIKKSKWGIYDVASVKAFSGQFSKLKTILYGYVPDEENKITLYLADQNHELGLVGRTEIKGICYLPEAGVKRGQAEGQNFLGDKLINGEIRKSKFTIPDLNKESIDYLFNQISYRPFLSDSESIPSLLKDTLIQSFQEKRIVVNSSSRLLSNKVYEGNVILYSPDIIEIDSSCKLNDILIFAPAVVIKKGFVGSLQAFCTDSIIVMENCKLNYPSALGILKSDFKVQRPFVRIKDNSSVAGFVFSFSTVQDMEQTLISIGKDSKVVGQVYAYGSLELKGEVQGSSYCNKFVLETISGKYAHLILDGTLDYSKLSEHYVGSNLLGSLNNKKIVKWLE